MSKDVESARLAIAAQLNALLQQEEEKVNLSKMKAIVRAVANDFPAKITDAQKASEFAVRNPSVLDYATSANPDGELLWKAISYASYDLIVDKLDSEINEYFVAQFEVDFDPLFEMQHFALSVVDDWEVIHAARNKMTPGFILEMNALVNDLKSDTPSEIALNLIGSIAQSHELKEKHAAVYLIVREAYSVRSEFAQRRLGQEPGK